MYQSEGQERKFIRIVKLIIKPVDITNSDGSVFFNGLSFVEKCAFFFEDMHFITALSLKMSQFQ